MTLTKDVDSSNVFFRMFSSLVHSVLWNRRQLVALIHPRISDISRMYIIIQQPVWQFCWPPGYADVIFYFSHITNFLINPRKQTRIILVCDFPLFRLFDFFSSAFFYQLKKIRSVGSRDNACPWALYSPNKNSARRAKERIHMFLEPQTASPPLWIPFNQGRTLIHFDRF